ncbi:P-type conjugative transfer protein TrbL [Pseudomonas fluorescens]|uniref:P-type conjugative transfer protein TrbL n=1 Tax=Pseudomonas fluorescens TaxID=294 RepID=UPI00178556FB|nr:P-type conjugative transfer protein TrbL [Pseudomonas fluorescens]MBD8191495.1 P-type conjugative transfer protein TrbL [Pseudomonas fluorescens]MBD8225520.1 P-type conjugative transfer protein TrbL [Pseudomonas fluorescens]MBD8783244.1 P-type conjugative transfer protein TrbL [Pseudomonas fluorescens]MBD8816666.1 P-type conjugative transfer protein TrbL [Pseudomonas fluorescens]
MKKLISIHLLIATLCIAQSAQAAGLDSGNMLNKILESFSAIAITWQSKILSAANWLFWSLALVSMVWTYGLMLLRNAGLQDFFAETIRFFGTLGFFWWLLINGPAISLSIIDTMRKISADASGLGNGLSPSGIVDIGFNILTKVSDSASLLSPVLSAVMLVAAIVVLVVLALIAVNMLLLLVSAWLLAYAGVFLLGFGGSRWTSDIAISFYKAVLGIGIQLFTMILLIGIGKSFIDQYVKAFQEGTPDLNSLCVLLVASVVLLTMVNKLPPMLAGLVGAGGQLGGIGSFGAGAAIGAATMAASAAASVGSAALAGASEAAGGTSSLSAAFKAAQANMESSSNDSGSIAGDSDRGQQAASGLEQSAFEQAIGSTSSGQESGYASRVANAARLAVNAGSLITEHVGQAMSSQAGAAIADTAGGRLAAAIDEGSTTSHTGKGPVFEGDNLSSRADEISDFVNKNPTQD